MTKKRMIANIILILAITVLVGIIVFSLDDISSVFDVIKTPRYQDILIAIALL